jgi:hypothetical protein
MVCLSERRCNNLADTTKLPQERVPPVKVPVTASWIWSFICEAAAQLVFSDVGEPVNPDHGSTAEGVYFPILSKSVKAFEMWIRAVDAISGCEHATMAHHRWRPLLWLSEKAFAEF